MFGVDELMRAFGNLVGKENFKEALPNDHISADAFASELLGFEEYEEGDDEDEIAEGQAMSNQVDPVQKMGGGQMTGINEVIPEREEDGF